MTLTHGYLARGSDILLKFNSIKNFPSLLTQISSLDKMDIPGRAFPLVFDNGNIGTSITLDINLIGSTYNVNKDWGSTGTIFEQFFEMKRVVYESGKFLRGSKPTKESGTKDYNTTGTYSYFWLTMLFYAEDENPFSSNFSIFDCDYIRSDKQGILVPVIPTTVSLKSTDGKNKQGIASIKFDLVSNVISFR